MKPERKALPKGSPINAMPKPSKNRRRKRDRLDNRLPQQSSKPKRKALPKGTPKPSKDRQDPVATSSRRPAPVAKPACHFIKADGRFIKASLNDRFLRPEAAEWPDLQIWVTDGQFHIIPCKEFISSRPSYFYQSQPQRPLCQGGQPQWPIKAGQAQWPFYEANGRFIKANGNFMAVLSRANGRREGNIPSLGPRD